jgi:superfamily II DNA/RNA helicase
MSLRIIQVKAIPLALENKDIIGQSETGSGKTLAYLLPIFQKIDSDKKEIQAIILAPTHELVMQIDKQIKLLSQNSEVPITSATMIGEVNIKRQIEKLKEKPHIIIGSTGRVLQLIKMKKLRAHTVKTIVIDEGDRLLDQNNLTGVKDVIKTTMRDRQLMVFSATINEKTLSIAKSLMKETEIIKIEEKKQVNPDITHYYLYYRTKGEN